MPLSDVIPLPEEDVRESVRKFVHNLRLATYDARLERSQAEAGQPTLFYYDTDVVLRMIKGLELLPSVQDKRTELVRSLLACFMLGDMYMLRPHALELRNHLHTTQGASSSLGPLKERAQQYLRARGLDSKMEVLRDIVTGADVDEGLTKAERFIRLFRADSSATFVAIEQISGHWTQRLRRHYGRNLHLDHLGPEMRDLLEMSGDVVKQIFFMLNEYRPDHRRENLQDAAALAILSQMVRDWQKNRTGPIVRFYSESPALWRAWREDPDLRALLSYPAEVEGGDGIKLGQGGDPVFRDASYFLARARFRELAPGRSQDSLDKLERFLSEVDATERMGPDEAQSAIERIRLEGKSIRDIIREFEDFSLMRGIWRRIPDDFAGSLEEWTDVFAFAKGRETGEALFQKINDIQQDLEGRVTHILRWTADRANLLRATREIRNKKISGTMGTIKDPMRDLGLVRWGYDLSDDEKQTVIGLVDNLMQCAEERLDLECAELASRMETARGNVRECLVITAVLWVMQLWTEIDRLVEDCARTPNVAVPASLRLIQAAARIRWVKLDWREKEALIQQISSLRDAVPSAQRGGYLLGLGYVLYHAWKQELRGKWVLERGVEEMPEYARVWASRCLEVGEQAVRLLSDADDLAWAYAVNHCAYVGLMTGVDPDRTQQYLIELSELRTRPAIWNARFDDTLGTDYLLRAEAALRSIDEAPPHLLRSTLDKIFDELQQAKRFLDQAREREFGDIDVEVHLKRTAVALDKLTRREKLSGMSATDA